jgi:hypothetical protein
MTVIDEAIRHLRAYLAWLDAWTRPFVVEIGRNNATRSDLAKTFLGPSAVDPA